MASWMEIERFRKDPAAMRALATHLLKHFQLNEWETGFLESIARRHHSDEFTTRQAEKLLQIRDDTEQLCQVGYGRFSVKVLIEGCQLGHLDLDESDDEWITSMPPGQSLVRRRDAGRLMQCARQLNLIEYDEAA